MTEEFTLHTNIEERQRLQHALAQDLRALEPSHDGSTIEDLLDTVDRHLLPYQDCDGKEFYIDTFYDCPNKAIVGINGQAFCERCAHKQGEL